MVNTCRKRNSDAPEVSRGSTDTVKDTDIPCWHSTAFGGPHWKFNAACLKKS
jgi:hypothetical protein